MDRSAKKVAEWKLSRWPQGYDKPPTVLIRADKGLDIKYNLPLELGWEFCEHNVVDSVQIVPGNHFSIFEGGNVEILSIKLRDLCKRFDNMIITNSPSVDDCYKNARAFCTSLDELGEAGTIELGLDT
ncbi:hypothetical protein GGP41_002774 [Bipolaris sorokiniana]|uniref:Uncharacterized protein n=1 Tax=Cochliobolus sativus TaxID=45130 RepID=A0A8H5Z5Y1_COCSA|nr:hypothetical protein GGP41_002774 [Bipolaris sorokiniana]